jgi:hypothetical protein
VKYAQVPFALQLFVTREIGGLPGAQTAIFTPNSAPELTGIRAVKRASA